MAEIRNYGVEIKKLKFKVEDEDEFESLVKAIKNLKKEVKILETDENEEENTFIIYRKKYQKLTAEINQVNVKRGELWKHIRDINKRFMELRIFEKREVEYREFIIEDVPLAQTGKELDFLNRKLDLLEEKSVLNKQEYHNKYKGKWNTLTNHLGDLFTAKLGKTNKEERRITAINMAQRVQFVYLKFYFSYYRDSLKNEIPYIDECTKVIKEYRDTLNMLIDTIDEKIFPFLETSICFLKSLSIKELIKEGKIDGDIKFENIEVISNISELKNTKYNIYFTFFENLFYLYTSIATAFTENLLTNLISLERESFDNEDLENIKNKIKIESTTIPEFGTLDWLIPISKEDETEFYSTDDIKFLNYAKAIESKKKEIEEINHKLNFVNESLEKVEEVTDIL
ncbi:hypothetical protein [Fusobacterium nucleatum]|jgi:hypothetical protein|uniref:hypothetical protein n=1 Tax=Fusobacterium nucleatum TaxID=851 RepID=UPI003567C974